MSPARCPLFARSEAPEIKKLPTLWRTLTLLSSLSLCPLNDCTHPDQTPNTSEISFITFHFFFSPSTSQHREQDNKTTRQQDNKTARQQDNKTTNRGEKERFDEDECLKDGREMEVCCPLCLSLTHALTLSHDKQLIPLFSRTDLATPLSGSVIVPSYRLQRHCKATPQPLPSYYHTNQIQTGSICAMHCQDARDCDTST